MEAWKVAALAVVVEAALVVAAAFGGPHGTLGGWPWVMQIPGILLVFYPPGGELFLLRVGAMAVVQTFIWFMVIRAIRRVWRRRPAESRPT